MGATYVLLIRTQSHFTAKRAARARQAERRRLERLPEPPRLLPAAGRWSLSDLVYLVLKYKYTVSISIK